jgi:hypothetical protein
MRDAIKQAKELRSNPVKLQSLVQEKKQLGWEEEKIEDLLKKQE